MRRFLAVCLLLLLAGCGNKAKDLYSTAQLGEKQVNKPHATKLYRQIIEEYPDSPYAESGFLDWIESIDVALTMPIKKGA